MENTLDLILKKLNTKDVNLGSKDALVKGVNFLAENVKVTLGAKGKNVLFIDPKTGKPKITKDGVTVTRSVRSNDPIEQMAIDVVKEASERTVKTSGDGTTTTIILAEYLILEGMKLLLENNISYYELAQQLEEAKEEAIQLFKNMSITIEEETIGHLLDIATVSASSREIGQFIYNIIEDIGIYGAIEVKSSNRTTDKIDKVKGIKVNRGFYAPQFVNNIEKMQWSVQGGVYIVLLDSTIRSMKDLIPYINHINGKRDANNNLVPAANGEVILIDNHPILFMVNDVEPTVLQTLINNKVMNPQFNVMFVEHDGYGERRLEIMNDIAALTGAVPGNSDYLGEIGFCEEVLVDETSCSILGGHADKKVVEDLVNITKAKLAQPDLEENDSKYFKRRLATLRGGVAVIQVGALTEVEMYERKDRIDDAVEAVKAAIERGVNIGGGYTHLHTSASIQSNSLGATLIKNALWAPFRQLCTNAGLSKSQLNKISEEIANNKGFNVVTNKCEELEAYKIYDPTGVLIDSLSNAVSVAKSILSTERTLYCN